MDDHVLVLNSGSSSLKFAIFRVVKGARWSVDACGQISAIGTAPRFVAKNARGDVLIDQDLNFAIHDCQSSLATLTDWLQAHLDGGRLIGVGHRVVHGGSRFFRPMVVTPEILAELQLLTPLAPLHQPNCLVPIEHFLSNSPGVPQIACFDTAFHFGRPLVAKLVPLPREVCQGEIERYGFHGISYEYIAAALPEVAPEIADRRVIVAHLGNGASLCALNNRVCIDTTMGFSTLDGLCMGTRPGSIDPGVILYLLQALGLSIQQVEDMLYKRSGLLAISGITSDMRQLLESNEPAARLAVEYFAYQATKAIGAMAAVLGGIDALVFTAGIGENSAAIRQRICHACSWLGLELDVSANATHGPRVSSGTSRVSAWVMPTNEELMIAHHVQMLFGQSSC